jgi:GNAT superfamily N-acetyltransferase
VTTQFTVRRVRASEWREFRELRLDALRTDPLAFGSTLERESAYAEDRWQDWCRRGATGAREATFVALDSSGRWVGMVGAFSAEGTPHLWGMWVRPGSRRGGVGGRLVKALLQWIARWPSRPPVLLDVNPSLEGAVRLYVELGFTFTGVEAPLGHDPPGVVRQMVRRGPRRR